MMMLQSFTTPSNFKTVFDYHGSTGLLRSKEDSTGHSYIYNFDEYGRLTESITPSGQVIKLEYNLSVKGASVTITRNDKDPVSLLIKGSDVTTKIGESQHFSISFISLYHSCFTASEVHPCFSPVKNELYQTIHFNTESKYISPIRI